MFDRQGSIPLWVLPSAYTIFFSSPRVPLEHPQPFYPPHTGEKVELQPESKFPSSNIIFRIWETISPKNFPAGILFAEKKKVKNDEESIFEEIFF